MLTRPREQGEHTKDEMKTAVLTTSWDDGHKCDVKLARMLKEHGLRATFYVAPKNQEFAERDLLSVPEIKDLSQDFEVGAHTMTHRRLPAISEQEAAREIFESKAVLEQVIGKPILDEFDKYELWTGTCLVRSIPTKQGHLCTSITTGSTYGRRLVL